MTARPGEGRYAHVEREQRWTVGELPAAATRRAEIHDRYIAGTRLRLRRVEFTAGLVHKLGQKVRLEPGDPEVVKLTNIYLSAEEYEILAALPATALDKTRWHLRWEGTVVAIDEFGGRLSGLVLAEVELGIGEDRRTRPSFAVKDVTNDDRFSGGALASTPDVAVAALLRDATTPED